MSIEIEKNIYRRLGDDISKKIFEKRLLYSISMEPHYIRDIIMDLPEGRQLAKELEYSNNNFIFGAGAWGKELAHIWQGYWGGL